MDSSSLAMGLETCWEERFGSDLTHLILSLLPIESIARASAVCKLWHTTIASSAFASAVASANKLPWFFLYGYNNVFLKSNQAFAFDPHSFRWLRLPFPSNPGDAVFFAGSGGFVFSAASKFSYAPILSKNSFWRHATPLHISRYDPLIGVFNERFIVVGGVKYVGGLVDIEDRLAVEIYDPASNSWEICPPLPIDFRPGGNSSQWLSWAISGDKFYVLGICSGFLSFFNLKDRIWSDVQTVRPPGVGLSFLMECAGMLILGGMCFTQRATFNLWCVEESTMELEEMGKMPDELVNDLFSGGDVEGDVEGDDYYDKFATLKCLGLGRFVFVFNEEHYDKKFPACVCEIGRRRDNNGGIVYNNRWRRLPHLPSPVNQFHKVITFCSTLSIDGLFVKS